jgi:iron(III) transport system ATP-binding protein
VTLLARPSAAALDGSGSEPTAASPRGRRAEPLAAVPMLEVRGLTVRFGATVAVDCASLMVPQGGITALVGPSGCGKTTLLRAVAGFGEIAAGTVVLAGRSVAGNGRWLSPEKRQVGMVFQDGALFPHLTVLDNVLYGLKGRADARQRARDALELVGMQDLGGRYPDELSGGQQQRVALARALSPAPGLVLLDEPFANLDAALRGTVREEVRSILERAGATAVLVTHDQEEALCIADRVAVMDQGKILQVGTPEEVYHYPATLEVARFIGDGQLLPCWVERGRVRCVFGSAPTDASEGEGLLLLRPEDLCLMPGTHDEGVPGVLCRRRFYGHDLIDDVCLEGSDQKVQVRSLASAVPPIGTRVRMTLRPKAYRVFSKA